MSPVFAIIDAPIIAVIIGAAIILFGAERLPKLARSMGQAKKEFDAAVSAKNPPPEPSHARRPHRRAHRSRRLTRLPRRPRNNGRPN